MTRLRLACLAAVMTLFSAGSALAQTAAAPPAASAKPAAPRLEPKAIEILKAASDTLRQAKTVSFTAIATYEKSAANGQPLYYSSVQDVTLQRPDKLRVITRGDGTPDEFYFDGKTMMAYVPSKELVAVAEAPATLDELVDHAFEKAAIYFPFSDVLSSDPYAELSKMMKSAFYVGRSIAVGGVTTDMVAVAGPDVAAEIWIGVDDHLPRLVRAVYANEPAKARYQTEYSQWKLGQAVEPGLFASQKAASARRIEFAPPGGGPPPKPAK
ncbi:MAG: DUF2092 domain-containing protein [Alsobacter sp.]